MTSETITYSAVIPVYNSTDSLVELCDRLCAVFSNVVRTTYEIILVDDASPNPNTWKTVERLTGRYDEVIGVQLMRNFGKAGAILCGFERAKGKYIFTLDDDMQHFPEDIPKFIENQHHDVVMGAYVQKRHSFSKRLTSQIKGWFDWKLAGKPFHLQSNPFRLYRSEVVKSMLRMTTPHPFISAMMYYTTQDIVTVDIAHGKRMGAPSSFNMVKRIKSFTNLLFNHSSFLLQVISIGGVSVSAVSLILGIYYILKNFVIGIPVPGWTSLMVVTLFTNGLLLFSVGVIGEYLIRIITGVERRPPYIIRKTFDRKNNGIICDPKEEQ
jgi:dolichol-phosphate mannosyltransferase/undecaprenyl-phosphate 4-deoxy-4-formamido-L-arabinose transferase